jgi:DNA-binding transcriptional ArsR family regulator
MARATFADLVATPATVLEFFRALADDKRLAIVRLLALSDLRAGEISAALRLPSNAVSYHLRQLSTLGLLQDHRSSSDGRDVYYRVDLEHLDRLYMQAGDAVAVTSRQHRIAGRGDAASHDRQTTGWRIRRLVTVVLHVATVRP